MTARVDAHHHLWDLTRREQPWMNGAWADPIRRTYTLDDLAPHLSAHTIDGTVLVQSSSSYEETAELLAVAERSDVVRGVVGWADLANLTNPTDLADLNDLNDSGLRARPADPSGASGATGPLASLGPFASIASLGSLEYLVGVRHQVQDEPDPEWLTRPEVLRGLGALADAGLVYDLLVTPRELPAALRAVRAVPHLSFVVDHAAKPAIGDGAWQPWADALAALARHPNVSCKLSGLVTEADRSHWRRAEILPYARHVLDSFGPYRVLFGSDWPVCTLAAPYATVVELAEEATEGLSAEERAAVFGANAERVYGL